MGRKPSKITKISGKMYRVTPYDPKAEKQRRSWDRENLRTVSTRLPLDTYEALERRCRAARTTVYAYVKRLLEWQLARELMADRTPPKNGRF